MKGENSMKIFEMPEIEIVNFNVTDVITTSVPEGPIAPCI